MARKKNPVVQLYLADPNSTPVGELNKVQQGESPSLVKSIINVLNGPSKDGVERLAFETDPSQINQWASVYRQKLRLIPDPILKRIAIQDDLIAAILNARSNQLASFGRPQKDRFGLGFKFEIKSDIASRLSEEDKKEVQERIKEVTKKLETCGETEQWKVDKRLTFSQYLFMTVRNGLTVGRIATEAIYTTDVNTGKKKFHSFRPIDAGTIFQATPQKEAEQRVREEARHILESLKNKKLNPEKFAQDEYAWIQVIEGRPLQAFTSDECLVHNLYPVVDIEMDEYPLTPIDTMISAVTTHINITTHNKLYFQNGRATRGMLLIKSDDVDEAMLNNLRANFNANVNTVSNSWRMPVIGVGAEDDIAWTPIDNSSRDMEFQYLSDNNARVILSAFQMSPEELPGYSHLSRGTNNQSLAESNREYQLEAHRDLGIRPLIANIEDFLNSRIFPLLDENLSKICRLRLMGLESDTPEKESVRIQQDAPVHMAYDEILTKVEKKAVGKDWGGEFPFNPQYQAILDKYFFVGEIMEHFFEKSGASQDPRFQYIRDPFYFQNLQLQAQMQQAQQQQQMAAQQAQQQQAQPQEQEQQDGGKLSQATDEATKALGKSESQLPPGKRRLLVQQKKLVENIMKDFQNDSKDMMDSILDIAKKLSPT